MTQCVGCEVELLQCASCDSHVCSHCVESCEKCNARCCTICFGDDSLCPGCAEDADKDAATEAPE